MTEPLRPVAIPGLLVVSALVLAYAAAKSRNLESATATDFSYLTGLESSLNHFYPETLAHTQVVEPST